MKEIVLGLAALAALSGAAFAERTDIDPRDRLAVGTAVTISQDDNAAYVAAAGRGPLTNFERVTLQSEENENSGN